MSEAGWSEGRCPPPDPGAGGAGAAPAVPPLAALLGLRPPPSAALPCDCRNQAADAAAQAALRARAEALAEAERLWAQRLSQAEEEAARREAAALARAEAMVETAADRLAELLLAGLRAILGALPELPPETVRSLAREAITLLADRAPGTLALAPDAPPVAAEDLGPGWTIVRDPAVPPGAAEARAGPSVSLDSVEHRLSLLARALLAGEAA